MRVHLGSDHAGFELKQHLADWLRRSGHEVIDAGPQRFDPEDDYPPYCLRAARGVAQDEGSLGIVIGGSGNGEQIAANKVAGVRCALVWSEETARLSREHNNANMCGIGARLHRLEDVERYVATFLGTPFTRLARHQRRIDQLAAYEATGELPSLPEV